MTAALIAVVSAGLFLVMTLAWAVQRRLGNAGWVDAFWSFGLGAAGVAYALAPAPGSAGPAPRQIIVAALVAMWSLRLGLHIAERSRRLPEDARYAQFRRDWGADFQRRMFAFLMLQAATAAFLALSILVAARNPRPFGVQDVIALAVSAAAILGEAVADAQLRRFRAVAANRGRICDIGLWRYSRHPNYFFEWLIWLAYPVFAIDLTGHYSYGWIALTGPAAMYWFLVHVSGIPPLEAHMLRSRGETYRAYQARTRPFLPLPRRADG
jgi:steroid 5-alpha reductase family enzyme